MTTATNRISISFEELYKQSCYQNNVFPQKSILNYLSDGILDICNADKLDQQNIEALLQPLKINKTLTFLAVRSSRNRHEPTDKRLKKRQPALQSITVLLKLCKSISNCLYYNNQLMTLELENLLLEKSTLNIIFQGLIENKSIAHLSFRHCPIGDEGIEIIGKVLRHRHNIKTVDLTSCNLSSIGARTIARVVQIQSMRNQNMIWKDSLRDQCPALDQARGLVRVSLNSNQKIADDGVKDIVDALREDICLQALDIQDCGLTSVSGILCVELLDDNKTLTVLDIRNNPQIGADIPERIKMKLDKNLGGQISKVKWLTSVNVTPKGNDEKVANKQRKQYLPWRIEERLNKVREYPCMHVPGKTRLEELLETSKEEIITANVKTCNNCRRLKEELGCAKNLLNNSVEDIRRLQSELDQVKDERDDLHQLLKEWPPKKCDQNQAFMDEETYVCINNTFERFQQFLCLLQETGLSEVLNVDNFEDGVKFLGLLKNGKPKTKDENNLSLKYLSVRENKPASSVTQHAINHTLPGKKPVQILKSSGRHMQNALVFPAFENPPSVAGCIGSIADDVSSNLSSMKSQSSGRAKSDISQKICEKSTAQRVGHSQSVSKSESTTQENSDDVAELIKDASEALVENFEPYENDSIRSSTNSDGMPGVIRNAGDLTVTYEHSQSYSSDFVSEESDSF